MTWIRELKQSEVETQSELPKLRPFKNVLSLLNLIFFHGKNTKKMTIDSLESDLDPERILSH